MSFQPSCLQIWPRSSWGLGFNIKTGRAPGLILLGMFFEPLRDTGNCSGSREWSLPVCVLCRAVNMIAPYIVVSEMSSWAWNTGWLLFLYHFHYLVCLVSKQIDLNWNLKLAGMPVILHFNALLLILFSVRIPVSKKCFWGEHYPKQRQKAKALRN